MKLSMACATRAGEIGQACRSYADRTVRRHDLIANPMARLIAGRDAKMVPQGVTQDARKTFCGAQATSA
jgi:site-specific recombinase XerC